jgi:hypothetical protein
MIAQTIQPGHPISPAEVWAGLTAECQARVIQSLARLASDLAAQQTAHPTPRRPTDGDPARRTEDPS